MFFSRYVSQRFITIFLVFGIAILLGAILLLAAVPPISKDALVHHLAVPKIYFSRGAMVELPSMPFSYYPMNLELMYMIPLYFGNDILPKYLHFGFALLTAGLIYRYLEDRIGRTYALGGALFFLSLPIIVKLSITVYVDLGLIFFSTAALLSLFRWREKGFKTRHLLISAFFCGLCLGTKYNGLIVFFLLTLIAPFLYARYGPHKNGQSLRAIKSGLLFFFSALIIFSPWMVRNYNWTQNPVYPLYNTIFRSLHTTTALEKSDALTQKRHSKKKKLNHFAYRQVVYGESWKDMALLPLRIFYQGKDGSPKYFDGRLNPFLGLLPLFAFWGHRKDAPNLKIEKRVLLGFTLFYFAFAFFSSTLRIRYIAPIIPPLVILSLFGVRNLVGFVSGLRLSILKPVTAALLIIALLSALVLNANYVREAFAYVDPLGYLSGEIDRKKYIARYRFEYAAMQYINKALPSDARLLFLFIGKRGYYCDRDYILDQRRILSRIIKAAKQPEEIYNGLRQRSISHLLLQDEYFTRWANDSLTGVEQMRLKEFFDRHLVLRFHKNRVGVYELKA